MKFKKIMYAAITVFILLIIAAFISAPQKYMDITMKGISLWAACVLPSTLPFLFFTALLTSIGAVEKLSRAAEPITSKAFNLSGSSAYVFLSGAICGYPVGAKIISDLYDGGIISSDETTGMSVISSMSGPLFIIGSVGANMYGNAAAGGIILLAQYLSVIITGLIFGTLRRKKSPYKKFSLRIKRAEADGVLYRAMYSSVLSVMCVGGFICVFYLLSAMAEDFFITYPIAFIIDKIPAFNGLGKSFAQGLIEVTGGCKGLSCALTPASLALNSFIITLGGMSVIFQQLAYLKKAKVSLRIFFLAKTVSAISAFFITLALSYIFI